MDCYRAAGPLLRRIDPERAHGLSLWALRHGLAGATREPDDPMLAQRLWGRAFTSPLGLAAGFDKDAEAVAPLLRLGFGFVEVGSITPLPQPGNPRPRLFRLPEDGAVINRLGFNSKGAAAAAQALARFRAAGTPGIVPGIVGVNLGKNRDSEDASADYVRGVEALAPHADYLVVNVSSPNTPGLRALQSRNELTVLLDRVSSALAEAVPRNAPPLLLKVAPDLSEDDIADIAAVALEMKLGGLIATNTTIARPQGLRGRHRDEAGGLSGRPLLGPSTGVLAGLYRETGGRLPLIGLGGVASGADAYAKIRAGASLVQLYTALIYRGPALIGAIKRDLVALLRRDGFTSIRAAVGADHR
jgi:dihydroorotate dehydrogenase